MYFVPFFLFSSIALAAKTTHNGYTVTGGELPRLSKRTPTLEKPLTLPLRRLNGSPPSQKYLRALTTGISNRVNLQEVFWGSSYLAPMTLSNGQQFQMVLDTGSSDTWIIQDGFICADPYTM